MFHLDLNQAIVSECSAETIDECIYSGLGGFNNHYESETIAISEKQKLFVNQFSWFGLRSAYSEAKHHRQVKELMNKLPFLTDRKLKKFVNSNRANFRITFDSVNERVNAKRRTNGYRDHTARILEFCLNSRFYNDLARSYTGNSLGNAIKLDDTEVDKKILAETLSATDVGVLALYDSYGDDERPDYLNQDCEKLKERRMTKHFTVLNNTAREQRKFNKNLAKFNEPQYGAMYRGTVWERKIRNDFALEHSELKVYSVDGKFRNKSQPWQLGIVDGVFSDRADGVPNGILEIKTSKTRKAWDYGVPINYRAQVLYYLHITGFEKAFVRVLIGERTIKNYVIHREDEIKKGSGVSMTLYLERRVIPLLKDWETMK